MAQVGGKVSWFEEYCLKDPEPPLDLVVDCRFTHATRDGSVVSRKGFKCYSTEQVLAHAAWLERYSAALLATYHSPRGENETH